MSKRQDEIRKILSDNDLSQAWLARRVGMSPQNLSYHLNESPELDADLFIKLRDALIVVEVKKPSETQIIPIEEAETNHVKEKIQYKIMGQVPAGQGDLNEYNDWQEMEDLFYDPRDHFYLRVDPEFGYSMLPLVNPGDLVLVSTRAKINHGDIVAAKWDDGKGALKMLSINPDLPNHYGLMSYNPIVPPLLVERNKAALYKVVLVKKKK